jgi:hypothetical protein
MQLGRPVVEACLDAGCHYFDTTGEMDWVQLLKKEFGPKFKAKGLALCPANSYMWAEGNIAAEIALETPGIDTLDIVYLADSQVSEASTASFLRMCTNPQHYLQNRELVMWPYATSYTVQPLYEHRPFNAALERRRLRCGSKAMRVCAIAACWFRSATRLFGAVFRCCEVRSRMPPHEQRADHQRLGRSGDDQRAVARSRKSTAAPLVPRPWRRLGERGAGWQLAIRADRHARRGSGAACVARAAQGQLRLAGQGVWRPFTLGLAGRRGLSRARGQASERQWPGT